MTLARFDAAGFFVLRSPLLPYDELAQWSSGLAAGDDAATLAANRALLRARLRTIYTRPDVLEALFIASPSLEASLPIWLEAPESERGQKIERTLVRYFTRMAARPTPFGLFAGCSFGRIGARSDLRVAPRSRARRDVRLDAAYLSGVMNALCRDPGLRRSLRCRANATAHRVGNDVCYVETAGVDGARRYVLSAVDASAPVRAALAASSGGASFAAIVDAVVATAPALPRAEAMAFVDELLAAQLIVAEIAAPVTGDDPLATLADGLRAADAGGAAAELLDEVRGALARLGEEQLGIPAERYREIVGRLRERGVDAEDGGQPFQVVLTKDGDEPLLGRDVIAELVAVTEQLARIGHARRDPELVRFRDAFVARYEQREVPLLTALDHEIGIGYPATPFDGETSPLLDGLRFGRGVVVEQRAAGKALPHLLKRLAQALSSGADEIELGPADVEAMADGRDDEDALLAVPDSLGAVITLLATSPAAAAAGELRIWLHSLSGPSGANLLGRFCHTHPTLTQELRAHLAREEAFHPDAIFAEVVHLPEGRVGNVVARPLLRQWEIPVLGRSGAPEEQQLPLEDLTVLVRNGRVQLRSRRTGRRVIPRLSTAHRHSADPNLGIYRFLCALQNQDARSLSFRWDALDSAPFLPRVRMGHVVLSPARWRLDAEELAALGCDSADERFRAMQLLRHRRSLPRWIVLTERDHVLPVDLDNVLHVESFARLVYRLPGVIVREALGEQALCAHGSEGSFVHELVVPLEKCATPRPLGVAPTPAAVPAPSARRRFVTGTEWLYAKLYLGPSAADELVRGPVVEVARSATRAGAAEQWFFIRYADPDWHVRLRIGGEPTRLREEVRPALEAAIAEQVESGLVWRVQLDTYEREIERYGGQQGAVATEQLFCADSDAAVEILRALRGDDSQDARWRLTLRGLDLLLDDLGLSLDRKLAVVSRCRDRFGRELVVDQHSQRALGEKFRRERLRLDALLSGASVEEEPFVAACQAFRRRSERVARVVAQLRSVHERGELSVTIEELASSYLHMHANRMLRSAARPQELVLYDFLRRLYEGQRARSRQLAAMTGR